jgi:integrase
MVGLFCVLRVQGGTPQWASERKMSYLLQTPKSYYFRMKVPIDLKDVLKTREIKKSLKTLNKQRAERLAFIYAAQWRETFESLREPKMTFPFTTIKVKGLEKKSDGTFRVDSIEMDPDKPEAETLLFKNFMQQLEASPLPSTSPANNPAKTTSGMLLSVAMEKFLKEKCELNPSAKHHYETEVPDDFRLIIRILGDKRVDEINRDDAIELFGTLKQLPANLNKIARFKGKTIAEILAMKEKTRAESTINGVMVNASALYGWLTKRDHVKQDYFEGLRVTRKKGGRERLDDTDLLKIFTHPIFTEHEYKYTYQYWLPLIALHSGMRMNEICQMRPQDVIDEDGILVMHVVEDGEDMSVKTDAGIRRIPVHPKLLQLGFGDFLQSRQKEDSLFDNLPVAEDGRRSKRASRWFCLFRPKVGLTVKGKDFHSFRHTIIDDLKQGEVNERVLKALVGHADQLSEDVQKDDITMDLYGKKYKAEILHKMVCRLDYSSVLGKIIPWSVNLEAARNH